MMEDENSWEPPWDCEYNSSKVQGLLSPFRDNTSSFEYIQVRGHPSFATAKKRLHFEDEGAQNNASEDIQTVINNKRKKKHKSKKNKKTKEKIIKTDRIYEQDLVRNKNDKDQEIELTSEKAEFKSEDLFPSDNEEPNQVQGHPSFATAKKRLHFQHEGTQNSASEHRQTVINNKRKRKHKSKKNKKAIDKIVKTDVTCKQDFVSNKNAKEHEPEISSEKAETESEDLFPSDNEEPKQRDITSEALQKPNEDTKAKESFQR